MAENITISTGITGDPIVFTNVVPTSASDRVNNYAQATAYSARFAEYFGQRIALAAQEAKANQVQLAHLPSQQRLLENWSAADWTSGTVGSNYGVASDRARVLQQYGIGYQAQHATAFTLNYPAPPFIFDLPTTYVQGQTRQAAQDAALADFAQDPDNVVKVYNFIDATRGLKYFYLRAGPAGTETYDATVADGFWSTPNENGETGRPITDADIASWRTTLDAYGEKLQSITQSQQVMFQELNVSYGKWLEAATNANSKQKQTMSALAQSIG